MIPPKPDWMSDKLYAARVKACKDKQSRLARMVKQGHMTQAQADAEAAEYIGWQFNKDS